MIRPRVSIGSLMCVVLVSAVGLAALRFASELLAGGMFLLTSVVLAVAVLGAIYARPRARARWLGFALFGWGYLLLAFGPWFAEMRPLLPTSKLFEYLAPRVQEPQAYTTLVFTSSTTPANAPVATQLAVAPSMNVQVNSPATLKSPGGGASWLVSNKILVSGLFRLDHPVQFQRVAHCLTALLAGLIGMPFALGFQGRREARDVPTTPTSGPSPEAIG